MIPCAGAAEQKVCAFRRLKHTFRAVPGNISNHHFLSAIGTPKNGTKEFWRHAVLNVSNSDITFLIISFPD